MDSALASASAISDQRQKIEQYKLILSSVLSSNDTTQAKKFIDHMVSDDVPLVVSRQLLQTFAQEIGSLEAEAQKEIAHYALTQIQPRVVSFEEQVLIIREKLAELYESEQQWSIISFEELGTLLGIAPLVAERIASKRIYDDRVRGSIDQVKDFIHFEDDIKELQQWDQQIEDCGRVSSS